MRINSKCVEIVKHFESLHDGDKSLIGLQPKMCPAGIWTEGYGNAMIDPDTNKYLKGIENKERAYKLSRVVNIDLAEKQLEENLRVYSSNVYRECKSRNLSFNQDQFSALVSFAYNCGIGAMQKVLDRHVQGATIPSRIMLYTKSGGKELPGLVRRRKSESYLFDQGKVKLNF